VTPTSGAHAEPPQATIPVATSVAIPTPDIVSAPVSPVIPPAGTPTARAYTTLITWDGIDDESAPARAQRVLLKAFHERYPAIRVEQKPRPPIEIVGQVFAMAGASGTTPDIFASLTPATVAPLAALNLLAPLEEYTGTWPQAGQVLSDVWEPFRTGGHVFGIPYAIDVSGLVWRKDRFAEVGLDPEKMPQTWDDLVNQGKRLTVADRSRYGYAQLGGLHAPDHWQNYLWQSGGTISIPVDHDRLRLTFADAAGVDALRFYQSLRGSHGIVQSRVDLDEPAIEDDLFSGKAAMSIVMTPFLGRVSARGGLEESFGFGALPAGPRARRASATRSTAYAIGERKKAEARDAAWTYLSWIVDPDQLRARWQLLLQMGSTVVPEASVYRDFRQSDHVDRIKADWGAGMQAALATGRPEYFGREQIEPILAEAINFALLKLDADAGQVLRDAAARITAASPEVIVQ
jgi:multiple sugar transport system substrate-binding protein